LQSKVKLIVFSILGLVLLVQFTNCANYSGESTDLSSTFCESGSLCTGPQQEALSLNISENSTISNLSTNKSFVLVSGQCSTGNYSSHRIKVGYVLRNGAQFTTTTYNDICLNGKFYIQLFVGQPGLSSANNVVHVEAQIYGVDAGNEVSSQHPKAIATLFYPN